MYKNRLLQNHAQSRLNKGHIQRKVPSWTLSSHRAATGHPIPINDLATEFIQLLYQWFVPHCCWLNPFFGVKSPCFLVKSAFFLVKNPTFLVEITFCGLYSPCFLMISPCFPRKLPRFLQIPAIQPSPPNLWPHQASPGRCAAPAGTSPCLTYSAHRPGDKSGAAPGPCCRCRRPPPGSVGAQ